jgi:hypothetical protein
VYFYSYIYFSTILIINGRSYLRDFTSHPADRHVPPVGRVASVEKHRSTMPGEYTFLKGRVILGSESATLVNSNLDASPSVSDVTIASALTNYWIIFSTYYRYSYRAVGNLHILFLPQCCLHKVWRTWFVKYKVFKKSGTNGNLNYFSYFYFQVKV